MNAKSFAGQFEGLCVRVLREAGYRIDREQLDLAEGGANWRVDFAAQRAGDGRPELRLVDVKWLPTPEATVRMVRNLASLYGEPSKPVGAGRLTVIVSSTVPLVSERWLRNDYGYDVWDREYLLNLVTSEELLVELREFFTVVDYWFEERAPQIVSPRSIPPSGTLEDAWPGPAEASFDLAVSSDPTEGKVSGKDLCRELHKVKLGAVGAADFEAITGRIFAYLFPRDLVGKRSMPRRTENGLNIFDLVYQIRNRSEFWTNLARDLRSRVLVVECKNYSDPIRAMQVYTTERYLSPSALRSIAFIVTRKKPHRSAGVAAGGALRESGKLMLILDEIDLCTMLDMRDLQLKTKDADQAAENDPAELVNDRLHRFLARLGR